MNDQALIQTARNLRKSVGVTALALPWLLMLQAGAQESLSAFYWTSGRDSFVAALALVSGFMFAYSGLDWRDRYAGRAAAVAASLVAYFPTAPDGATTTQQIHGAIHGGGALVFFGSLAYMAYQLFPRGARPAMVRFYRACSVVIVAAMAVSAVGILFGAPGRYVLIAETIAITAFGASWWLIAREVKV